MTLYVRIHFTAPGGAGELNNIAELEEISPTACSMLRMIELDAGERITGIYADGEVVGHANVPLSTVPHPRTYHQYEGIDATALSREEFEGLWQEANAVLRARG